MDGRELMIAVGITNGATEIADYTEVEFWDEKLGDASILKYCKTCHEMICYKNGAYLIINKGKEDEITIITDIYSDVHGSLWVKARDINQDFETRKTKSACCMNEVVQRNK